MENIIKTIIGLGGALLSFLFGEWSGLIAVLIAFVVIDYISGVAASAYEGKLSSKIGFKSIPKKIMIFALVAVGHLVDQVIGDGHMFRDAIIFFFLANELISITENAGRVGLPVPEIIKQAIDVLKGRSNK